MSQGLMTATTKMTSSKRLFWAGVTICAITVVIDIALTAAFVNGQLNMPQMLNTIINRITTLLTVLGPMMIVGALVVDLVRPRDNPAVDSAVR